MAFRLIGPGEFRMGSRGISADEEPVHVVRITQPFWLGETPVTQSQFAIWTAAECVTHKKHFENRPENPAESLSWRNAGAYCAWLAKAKSSELPDGFPLVCLPTEAEWEYACRADTETDYHTGDGEEALAEAGWFDEDFGTGSTHPVRGKSRNKFGLWDLHGNVWEWCHDVWDREAYCRRVDGVADPGARERIEEWSTRMVESALPRVLRGGSWFRSAVWCRSAYRYKVGPDDRNWNVGFRVCLVRGLVAGAEHEVAEAARDRTLRH